MCGKYAVCGGVGDVCGCVCVLSFFLGYAPSLLLSPAVTSIGTGFAVSDAESGVFASETNKNSITN